MKVRTSSGVLLVAAVAVVYIRRSDVRLVKALRKNWSAATRTLAFPAAKSLCV